MTDKQMTARALDAAIAERVLGEAMPPIPQACDLNPLAASPSPKGFWTHVHVYDQGDVCEWQPLAFSASVAAAWGIVEHLRERGIWTLIHTFTHTAQVRVEMGVPSSECQEWGDTVAEAICKCALNAIEKFKGGI
jgi:hypothetical protein